MEFFMKMKPPTATAQERKIKIIKGRPVFFDTPKVREARAILMNHLSMHKPRRPLEGPLELQVTWLFPKGRNHKDGEWRVTRPDTDNLEKLLKDCMTRTGYWKDDAQVVRETVEKKWAADPTGIQIKVSVLEICGEKQAEGEDSE